LVFLIVYLFSFWYDIVLISGILRELKYVLQMRFDHGRFRRQFC
jgi:hypothetical protein